MPRYSTKCGGRRGPAWCLCLRYLWKCCHACGRGFFSLINDPANLVAERQPALWWMNQDDQPAQTRQSESSGSSCGDRLGWHQMNGTRGDARDSPVYPLGMSNSARSSRSGPAIYTGITSEVCVVSRLLDCCSSRPSRTLLSGDIVPTGLNCSRPMTQLARESGHLERAQLMRCR